MPTYYRSITAAAWIIISLGLSIEAYSISRKLSLYDIRYVNAVREYSNYVSIVVRLLSGILAKIITYVADSTVVFVTNYYILFKSKHLSPMTLDELKLLHAMKERALVFEWNQKTHSLYSIVWLLFMQIPAVVWVGCLTPVTRLVWNPDIQVKVPVPKYTENSRNFWARNCAPAAPACDSTHRGFTTYLGTFSYIGWQVKTGLFISTISQASSSLGSGILPRIPKLDNTGYAYSGRSYGVAASVGLQPLQIEDREDDRNISSDLIDSYAYNENGYLAKVNCTKTSSSQLSFVELELVQTPGLSYYPQAYWAGGSLPNGAWDGFPTWGVSNSDRISALAGVIGQDRYLYGFLGGSEYPRLNDVQCEVTFTPTMFNVSVNVLRRQVIVTPATTGDGGIQRSTDIDPSRALVNNSFLGVSYLSQVSTTLYTSVLGDAFSRNIDNVLIRNKRGDSSLISDELEAITEGLELLLDNYLGGIGAAQIIVGRDYGFVNGKVTLQAVQIGNIVITSALLVAVGFFTFVAILALGKLGWGWRGIHEAKTVWQYYLSFLNDRDFLDYKSVVVAIAKGTGCDIDAVVNWEGDTEDVRVGELEIEIEKVGETSLRLSEKMGRSPSPSSDLQLAPLRRI
ncbi:hypothetical protein TWF730_009353 [Orbilia blumenaviensis]|uniref:Uncharacterized protein n=1 Tax=Orbilia blumenaviensis TaxID=1796055 RepID=A0AAV9UYT3_9PEZI